MSSASNLQEILDLYLNVSYICSRLPRSLCCL